MVGFRNFARANLRFVVVAILLASSSRVAGAAGSPAAIANAESLFAAGRLEEAQSAFAALLPAPKGDTTIAVRLAQIRLLRNDRAGTIDLLKPVLAGANPPRRARSATAEAYARNLDFAHAAPLMRTLGREAMARQYESFAGVEPYRYEGPDRVVVPFVQTDPLPLIEVRLNGKGPYLFLIDTGGGETVVDPMLADSLGCPKLGDEEGTFGGGRRRPVTKSKLSSLALGDATFHDIPIGLLDTSRFSALAMGRRISGVLGTLVLMRRESTLDYPGGALIMKFPAMKSATTLPGFSDDSSRVVIPMWLGGDHYLLARGRMNDAPEALWLVDTGLAGAAITAPASTLEESGIAVPDTSGARSGIGGGGSVKIQPFAVTRFRLGEAGASGLLGFYGGFPPTMERALGCRVAGIISHAFFRKWRVTFDFDAMNLILEKPKAGN